LVCVSCFQLDLDFAASNLKSIYVSCFPSLRFFNLDSSSDCGSATAMPFDWQAELSATVVPAPPARVQSPPSSTPKAATSFAQVLTATLPVSSNDNLPQPYIIRGETLGIKISQEIYEKGIAFCKHHLRGVSSLTRVINHI